MTSNCIQNLEKRATVGTGSSSSICKSFPPLLLSSLFPWLLWGPQSSSGQWAACEKSLLLLQAFTIWMMIFFFFKCLRGNSSWVGWILKGRFPIIPCRKTDLFKENHTCFKWWWLCGPCWQMLSSSWAFHSSAKTNAFARRKDSLFGAVITALESVLLCNENILGIVSEYLYLLNSERSNVMETLPFQLLSQC